MALTPSLTYFISNGCHNGVCVVPHSDPFQPGLRRTSVSYRQLEVDAGGQSIHGKKPEKSSEMDNPQEPEQPNIPTFLLFIISRRGEKMEIKLISSGGPS